MPVERGDRAVLTVAGRQPAVLSHDSAAVLWGLRPARPGPIDVTVLGRETRDRAAILDAFPGPLSLEALDAALGKFAELGLLHTERTSTAAG